MTSMSFLDIHGPDWVEIAPRTLFFSLVYSDFIMRLMMTWLCKLWRLSCSLNIEKILVFVSWTLWVALEDCWQHLLFSQFLFLNSWFLCFFHPFLRSLLVLNPPKTRQHFQSSYWTHHGCNANLQFLFVWIHGIFSCLGFKLPFRD